MAGLTREAEKISNLVRSASVSDSRSNHTPTPTQQWDSQSGARPNSYESNQRQAPSNGRESAARGSIRDSREQAPSERYGPSTRHTRSDSEATGIASSVGYSETTQSGPPGRRHDWDVQTVETTPASPRASTKNPIPTPTLTVRSEFPTINRSRHQQTLTCLVTVEVPDTKWRPDPEDLGAVPPNPPPANQTKVDDAFQRPPSPARSVPRFHPYESQEVLEEMTEHLRNRVDNWHGLDFSRSVSRLHRIAPPLWILTVNQVRQASSIRHPKGRKRQGLLARA